jgi:cell wall-associated NlpC family hydrolase
VTKRRATVKVGDQVAAEAQAWVGTPFVWGQSVKPSAQGPGGCDCKGLVAGVARELGRPEAASTYALFAHYRADRRAPADLLLEGMAVLFDRVGDVQPGDVLLLKHEGQPRHMAIAVGGGRAVHALPGFNSSVRERPLDVITHRYPLHSIWRWKEA